MSTRLKFVGRYQILENNKAIVDPSDLQYEISNVVDLNNGTRFTLAPGESIEFVQDLQANVVLVISDDAVTVATDTNSVTGNANFTVDSNTDILFASKDIFPYTSQQVTLTTAGTLPAPLVAGTTYYVISRDSNELLLATSESNAKAGTQIDITDTGTGVHTLDLVSTYTQNIDDFTQSNINILTGANAKRVTIKNTSAVNTTGRFYSARTAS